MRIILKKIFLIIFSISITFSVNSQLLSYQNDSNLKSLGIGVLKKNNVASKINYYLDSSFQKEYDAGVEVGQKITPLLFKPDYGICFFVCIKATNKYFIVKSNRGINLYIKVSEEVTFFLWDNFLCNEVIGVTNKDSFKNPPRYNVNGKIINTENWSSDDEQKIIIVKRDWIKVKNETRKIIYWIKWKQENNLLVYLNLLI